MWVLASVTDGPTLQDSSTQCLLPKQSAKHQRHWRSSPSSSSQFALWVPDRQSQGLQWLPGAGAGDSGLEKQALPQSQARHSLINLLCAWFSRAERWCPPVVKLFGSRPRIYFPNNTPPPWILAELELDASKKSAATCYSHLPEWGLLTSRKCLPQAALAEVPSPPLLKILTPLGCRECLGPERFLRDLAWRQCLHMRKRGVSSVIWMSYSNAFLLL